jgi:alkylation response protein AidB-like acyl-CoA dehydrogenase
MSARISEIVTALAPQLAERAAMHDAEGTFVEENFAELRRMRVPSLGVPEDLGGGGASHRELCTLLRELGRHCGSTALALSMHTHLLAVNVYKHKRGEPGEQLLRRIAAEQLVLVSTGAADWLASNGRAERVDGGYRVSAQKIFASGSPRGDLLITSAPYEEAEGGAQVLHFPVSMKAEGVRLLDDWDAMGMRGTGSHTVVLDQVFVPDAAIGVRRPKGTWHPMWSVILTVAPPLYMAPYLGVAEAAAEIARQVCKPRASDTSVLHAIGEMESALALAQMTHDSMTALANEYDFAPSVDRANAVLVRKPFLARTLRDVVQKAMEAVGGGAYFRRLGIERLLRDVTGAQFHPLQEKRQIAFTGRLALGLEPA